MRRAKGTQPRLVSSHFETDFFFFIPIFFLAPSLLWLWLGKLGFVWKVWKGESSKKKKKKKEGGS